MPAAVEVFHYLTPFAVSLYYLVATTIGVCTLRAPKPNGGRDPRNLVIGLMLAMLGSYVCENVIILTQLSNPRNAFATTDSNIYGMGSTLVWSILTATLLSSESIWWYPYGGSWLIAVVSEVVVFVLHMVYGPPCTGPEYAQVAIQVFRIVVFVGLPVVTFVLPRMELVVPHTDEEAAPLLTQPQESSEDSEESGGSYGSASTDGIKKVDSTSDSETDKIAAREKKEEEEKMVRMQKRLKEAGNWVAYVRGFSVFLQYVWPSNNRRLQLHMISVGLCLVAVRVLNVLVPRQLGLLVNSLGHANSVQPFMELSIFVGLSLLDSSIGIEALRAYLWLSVENQAYKSIDNASFNHIMSLSSDFHDSKQSGELYQAMHQGRSVIELLETMLYQLVPMSLDLVIACFYVYYLFDAYMVLIVTSTMVIYLWASAFLVAKQIPARRINLAAWRRAFQVLYDTMGGWKTVSYFNRMRHAQETYLNITTVHLESRRVVHVLYFVADGIKGLILDAGLYGACFYAVYQVMYNNSSVGQFVTLFTYWSNLAGPLNTLSSAYREIAGNLADAEELLLLFQTKPSIVDGPAELRLDEAQVDFEHVKFSYDGKKQILNDVNFHVKPGKTIALIGETGGGKSTILKLLFRFYDVTEGSILIDGQDIRNVTLESLRECIGVVPQDPSLFNDTIMNNLRYAKLDATTEEIVEACKAAAIHDKILTFTDGYMSKVGENGVRLSGGELQRIAIARAILKNPKIILLDEATSSVDSETEEKIQEALKRLSQGRTTFVVAHRLSTVTDADLIIVIKDGAILEQGPPAELLKSKGKYYTLWAKQMGIQTSDEDIKIPIEENKGQEPSIGDTPKISQLETHSGNELPQTENETSKKDSKRLTPRKVSSSKHRVFSFGKKKFRPDAPEFVPHYQQATAASASQENLNDHEASSHGHSHKVNVKSLGQEKKQRTRKRKGKQDSFADASHGVSTVNTSGNGSYDAAVAHESAANKDDVQKAKKSRFNRRHQSKSEPPKEGLQQSQADGASEFDETAIGSAEGLPARNPLRRVTAPSDPPLGPPVVLSGNQARRRRRQQYWKSKTRDMASTTPPTQSSGTGQDWSSDGPSTAPPTVPFTSPAGGVTPMNEVEGALGGHAVRFTAGF